MGGEFLKVFGKPDRLLTCECERSESTTLAQAFQLINGEAVRRRLWRPTTTGSAGCSQAGAGDAAIVDELYLAILSRPPTARERDGCPRPRGQAERPPQGVGGRRLGHHRTARNSCSGIDESSAFDRQPIESLRTDDRAERTGS